MELRVVIISVVACGAELQMFIPTESSVPQPTPSLPACSELPRHRPERVIGTGCTALDWPLVFE